MIRRSLWENWKDGLLALFLGFSLWAVVNLGVRVPVFVERSIEIINEDPSYAYKLDRKRVKIKLLVIERLNINESLEGVRAVVDVRGLGEGEYVLKVSVITPLKFLVYPSDVEPQSVKVYVKKKPPGGRQ